MANRTKHQCCLQARRRWRCWRRCWAPRHGRGATSCGSSGGPRQRGPRPCWAASAVLSRRVCRQASCRSCRRFRFDNESNSRDYGRHSCTHLGAASGLIIFYLFFDFLFSQLIKIKIDKFPTLPKDSAIKATGAWRGEHSVLPRGHDSCTNRSLMALLA